MAIAPTANITANQTYVNGTQKRGGYNDISMQDFFTLLAAQLKNQNMLNPVEDTQFLSQMAQFSSLSATQELNESFSNFLSVSYIGKNVKASHIGPDGETELIEGTAQKVEFIGGETYITVNDVKVTFNEIIEISI